MKKRSIINYGMLITFAILTILISIAVYAQDLDPYPTIVDSPTGPTSCIEVYPGYWDCI